MPLTLEEANRIVRGAIAKAQELNIRISAAVCDSGGRLIALQRTDNAIWASLYGSQGKAVASAAFGRLSGKMSERPRSGRLAWVIRSRPMNTRQASRTRGRGPMSGPNHKCRESRWLC
jgi:uncharacterized protein GlcG (DUF336 family)